MPLRHIPTSHPSPQRLPFVSSTLPTRIFNAPTRIFNTSHLSPQHLTPVSSMPHTRLLNANQPYQHHLRSACVPQSLSLIPEIFNPHSVSVPIPAYSRSDASHPSPCRSAASIHTSVRIRSVSSPPPFLLSPTHVLPTHQRDALSVKPPSHINSIAKASRHRANSLEQCMFRPHPNTCVMPVQRSFNINSILNER